ncbi:MAG: hypothetical protein RLN85_16850, partial [Pseudomonadales bacterium]
MGEPVHAYFPLSMKAGKFHMPGQKSGFLIKVPYTALFYAPVERRRSVSGCINSDFRDKDRHQN